MFWSNYSDLTRPIFPKWWFSKGNPLISGKSRLVKYYNLARILSLSFFCLGVGWCCSLFQRVFGWQCWFCRFEDWERSYMWCWKIIDIVDIVWVWLPSRKSEHMTVYRNPRSWTCNSPTHSHDFLQTDYHLLLAQLLHGCNMLQRDRFGSIILASTT